MRIGFRRLSLLAASICASFLFLLQYRQWTSQSIWSGQSSQSCSLDENHWINGMIRDAERHAENPISARTLDLQAAAAEYRKRRGRHPPPGFDVWYKWGIKHNRIMVEEFFDHVYDDLEPYWGVSPHDMRASIASWPADVLRLRNGKVLEHNQGRFRTRTWAKMLKEISSLLPDIDIAVNPLDEPRILVSRDVINDHLKESAKQKQRLKTIPLNKISGSFQRGTSDQGSASKARFDVNNVGSYHKVLSRICGEGNGKIAEYDSRNVTAAKDICTQPQLLKQHGFFLEPATLSFSTSMIPVFSATKTSINNDILLPEPAYYFDQFGLFSGNDLWAWFRSTTPWSRKKHGLIWRGGATGGVARSNTWNQFHRHRFVMALNSSLHQADKSSPKWLHQSSDVAFTSLSCDERKNGKDCCAALASNFHKADPVKMHKQYSWKYLPDIDGNSLSGRFRAFMLSDSAPIKATIFQEWHDNRLVPWKHFIPVSIGFEEIYDIMRYFLGSEKMCAHDDAGEKIAKDGQQWAERVLQKEDMLLYMYRVLLEYARVVDDERDYLGYVMDLEK